MSTNVKKHSHPTLAQTCMASLSSVYETSMVMTRLSTVSAKRHYLEILGKVCGDKWQSISTCLAKYLDILQNPTPLSFKYLLVVDDIDTLLYLLYTAA